MERLAVFITLYDRLGNLESQLEQLDNQSNKAFDLYIVNNTPDVIDVPQAKKVFHLHNKWSIYGRLFAIKQVRDDHEIILNLDDDQTFPKNMIDYAYRQYSPDAIKSFWCFEMSNDYWNRKRVTGTDEGNYAGCGGLLAPTSLFHLERIYYAPPKYWIIDDLWLTHCILAYTDYKILPFNVPIKFIEDNKATYRKIKDLKSEFAKEYVLPYI